MTTADGDRALDAAAGNWRWLTGLTRTDSALYIGDAAHPLPAVLALQFGQVVSMDRARAGTAGAVATIPDNGFEYAVLHGVLEWWDAGTPALARTAFRVLRPDGWVAIAGSVDRRPRRLAVELHEAGFRQIREYLLAPSYTRPYMVVPRTRGAALACEQDRRQLGGNRARIALAAVGMYDRLYAGWLLLASR